MVEDQRLTTTDDDEMVKGLRARLEARGQKIQDVGVRRRCGGMVGCDENTRVNSILYKHAAQWDNERRQGRCRYHRFTIVSVVTIIV